MARRRLLSFFQMMTSFLALSLFYSLSSELIRLGDEMKIERHDEIDSLFPSRCVCVCVCIIVVIADGAHRFRIN